MTSCSVVAKCPPVGRDSEASPNRNGDLASLAGNVSDVGPERSGVAVRREAVALSGPECSLELSHRGRAVPRAHLSRSASSSQRLASVCGEGSGRFPMRFYEMRHAYASALISAGCSVRAVQHALGHAKPSTTLNLYSHLWPGDEDRLRLAVDAAFGAAGAEDSLRTEGTEG